MNNRLDKKIFNYIPTLENTNGELVSKGLRNIRLKTYILILLSLFIFFGCSARQKTVKPTETIPLEPEKPVAPEMPKDIPETSRAIAIVSQGADIGPSGIAESVPLYNRMIAVVIGIDRYLNLRTDNQLKYAVHDAKGVEKVLGNHYPFEHIISLYNEEATRERIMKVLQGDLTQVGPDDAVLIYFAGHGITLPTAQGDLGYLVPHDGSLKMEETYKNISMQQIKADVCSLIPAKHVLIIADACFGGLLLATRSESVSPTHKLAYLREITREPVRQIITAGGKDERVLDGGPGGHSVFTGRLIEVLEKVTDFITARELGVKIQQQVYGDAAARGHKQRPLVGEIYGTGDFVFVPDVLKRQEALEEQVKRFEEELAQLEQLEKAAQSRKEKSRIRELERQRLLKEAALNQARLRKEAAKREAQLRARAEEEAKRDKEEMRRREKERNERLAHLKLQTQRLREKLGSPASALGLDDAVMELKRINKTLTGMEADFANELDIQLKPLREYHGQKIAQAEDIEPRDKMFETEADYRARVSKQMDLVRSLKAELAPKEQQIRDQLRLELAAQKNPLMEQRHKISEQEFTLGPGEVKFKFLRYVPEKEYFVLFVEPKKASGKAFLWLAHLRIPKAKAKEYWYHRDLLVPRVILGVKSPGIIFPKKIVFFGSEGAIHAAKHLLTMEFVYIPPGTFIMGSPYSENGRYIDEKEHRVTLSRGFYMQATEVTQAQWQSIMGNNPSFFKNCGGECPVERVSWIDAQDFIRRLNQKKGTNEFRLPTEAEWEYACRAGSTTAFANGGITELLCGYDPNLDAMGWYCGNSGKKTHPVAQKNPNAWGLYDMHGNVSEWCQDWFGDYTAGHVTDPKGPSSGDYLVYRGGCWNLSARHCRSAFRLRDYPGLRYNYHGFRLARDP